MKSFSRYLFTLIVFLGLLVLVIASTTFAQETRSIVTYIDDVPVSEDETFAANQSPLIQEPDAESIEAGTFQLFAPEMEVLNWTTEPPALTPEQESQLAYWLDNTHLPGPARTDAMAMAEPSLNAVPGTESVLALPAKPEPAPLVESDNRTFRRSLFGPTIPSGYKSNVMESSVGNGGRYVFFTGNWFAARNTRGGKDGWWSYVSSYSGFPNFCCDQVTIYDAARDLYAWLRMGNPAWNADNYENEFRLSISTDNAVSFCTYSITPRQVNGTWEDQWWDYPHIQLGARHLYMTWNMFNNFGNWTRTVMLRFPMESLATCSPVSGGYIDTSAWFTFVPVQGADHTMYWASNWPMSSPFNRMRIWWWDEDSGTVSWLTRDIASWSWADGVCGGTSTNWLGRADPRLLSGARYEINNTDLKVRGRKILAWWWNVAAGGSFSKPYIDAAAFYEDSLLQVSGEEGRPYIWNPDICFGYPSASSNNRGDLAVIFHYGGSQNRPFVGYLISDDYTPTLPGGTFYTVRNSLAKPSDSKWGDYNTLREFSPTERVWVAGSHYIDDTTNCSNCAEPVFFIFGRERDLKSWRRWTGK